MKSTSESKKKLQHVPHGKPKSGRIWKQARPRKFSSIVNVQALRSSWDAKMQQRAEKKNIKEFENTLKDAKQKEVEDFKERRKANLKKKEENAKKAEVVQVITNPNTLKKMKKNKKQWKTIQKR